MGGEGSGRKPDPVKQLIGFNQPAQTGEGELFIPNYSGIKDAARKDSKLPLGTGGGAVEGVDVLSTGEAGGTKYLREDGDGTCSWQTPAGAGDVTASANLTDETIVQGDGGAKGVKTSTATVAQIADNVTHSTGDGSDHADVADNTAGIIALSGARVINTEAITALSGARVINSADIIALSGARVTNTENITTNDADITALSGARVFNTEGIDSLSGARIFNTQGIDALSGARVINSADILALSGARVINTQGIDALSGASHTHIDDNTQAHSDYLLNSEADVGVGLTLTGDNSSADTAYVPMVLYNTDATPPAASGFPVGTIYIQYTA